MKNLWVVASIFVCHFAFAAHFPVVSGRSLEQRADTIYEMVGKELIYTTKTKEKFKSIQASIQDFNRLLDSDENMTPENREHIETYVAALKSLPSKKEFKKENCDEYEVDPKAKPLLDGLCQ